VKGKAGEEKVRSKKEKLGRGEEKAEGRRKREVKRKK